MKPTRKIIATSAGFAIEPRNRRMDRYILDQASAKKTKICFIGTASGDSKNYVQRFYNFFEKENCICTDLPLFKTKIANLKQFVFEQDILYVGGGNTKSMLAIWREWGLDDIIKQAYRKGVLLCGISAGSLCWFEEGFTDSSPGRYTSLPALGLLKGSNCPFHNINPKKGKKYEAMIKSQQILPGIASDLGVGLHYENEKLIKVVSSRKGAMAYKVFLENGNLKKESISPDYITSF